MNSLSNFVADAVNVVGFDPFTRLVEYLVKRPSLETRTLAFLPWRELPAW